MRILVTNDDGIYSPGSHALATVAARFGQVRVVAPDADGPPALLVRRQTADRSG